MASVINLQKIAESIYGTVMQMNQSATQMVGLDAIWCRLLPYDNGEDIIVQEYTLHQYECPQNIKIVSNNANYNVGNFAIDLFGIKNAETLEINIDIETWKSIYGNDTMPQKGDFVLIPIMHRPYEVISTTPVHTIGQRITHWKCILGEWKHAASRKESEDFKISIDELTNAQDRLFGETISKEVADAVNDVETAYNTTTYVDPFKEFDMQSVITEQIMGAGRNIITNSYYSFANTNKSIKYKLDATYNPTIPENKWIYSCWFGGITTNTSVKTSNISLSLQTKDKDYWYFNVISNQKLSLGEEITIYRGKQIILNGIIETDNCSDNWLFKVNTPDCLRANKKINKFWESGIWKVKPKTSYNLFTANNNDNNVLKIDIDSDKVLSFKNTDTVKKINLTQDLDFTKWNYIAIEIQPTTIRVVIVEAYKNPEGYYFDKLIYDEIIAINTKTFSFDNATITNHYIDFNMANIRLFENEYELGDTYKQDMYSQVVRNASKLILVDIPKPANNMSFKTAIR